MHVEVRGSDGTRRGDQHVHPPARDPPFPLPHQGVDPFEALVEQRRVAGAVLELPQDDPTAVAVDVAAPPRPHPRRVDRSSRSAARRADQPDGVRATAWAIPRHVRSTRHAEQRMLGIQAMANAKWCAAESLDELADRDVEHGGDRGWVLTGLAMATRGTGSTGTRCGLPTDRGGADDDRPVTLTRCSIAGRSYLMSPPPFAGVSCGAHIGVGGVPRAGSSGPAPSPTITGPVTSTRCSIAGRSYLTTPPVPRRSARRAVPTSVSSRRGCLRPGSMTGP